MFAVVFYAALLFATTDSAVIFFGNFENEVNRIEDWARENAHETEEWVQNEDNMIEKWAKENSNETVEWVQDETKMGEKWAKEKLDGAEEWIQNEAKTVEKWTKENYNEAEKWVKNEKEIGEKWAKETLNEVDGWAQSKLVETQEVVKALMPKFSSDKCVCYHQTCGCCVHAEEPEIHLNSTVCVNVTYLSEDYGISFTVTLNNHTLYNETVSVRNPPPVCAGFPYVKELADICIRLYDIDAKSRTFHACARLEARMKFIIIAHYDLGCFTIGSSSVEDSKKKNGLGTHHPSVILI
ncbi:uncharacterized protein LOC126184701 [Schistocerca cancellata]|uniref:uncharacterized protein LOC126184701 n=1 Tax=Schistocerca cancellata TaxID=274614 RepID=UPI002119791F|nr:uncharacterized protein LOC126184701 [Schistocerca cancellata]